MNANTKMKKKRNQKKGSNWPLLLVFMRYHHNKPIPRENWEKYMKRVTIMRFFKNYSTTLLTIGASAGVIFTAIAASKSTLKASEILKNEELKTIDKIKIVAPNYIFPIFAH